MEGECNKRLERTVATNDKSEAKNYNFQNQKSDALSHNEAPPRGASTERHNAETGRRDGEELTKETCSFA